MLLDKKGAGFLRRLFYCRNKVNRRRYLSIRHVPTSGKICGKHEKHYLDSNFLLSF